MKKYIVIWNYWDRMDFGWVDSNSTLHEVEAESPEAAAEQLSSLHGRVLVFPVDNAETFQIKREVVAA